MWRQEFVGLWRLALPLAGVRLGNQMKSFVDTAVVGRLGDVELAAVGLANGFFFVIAVLGLGAMMGFDPLVAQALGAERPQRARQLLWQSVWVALAVGMGLAVLVLVLPWVFVPAGIEPEVAQEARTYMWIRALGLWPVLIFAGMRSYLQAIKHTAPLIWAMIASNILNLGLTILLVFGGADLPAWTGPLRDVPAMGVAGSAWATVACTVLQLVMLVVSMSKEHRGPLLEAACGPSGKEIRQAVGVGLPIGLQYAAEVGVFALVGFLAGRLGSVGLAGHQVALTLASLPFMISLGISSAGSVMVGRAVGALDAVRARVSGWVALTSGTAFMGLSASLFWLAPEPLVRLLTTDAEVIALAVPLLFVAAVFQLSDGLQAIAAGVLRGAGDTRFAFVANVLGHYAVGMPVAVALGMWWGQGVMGLWWGLCAGLTVVAAALMWRFWKVSSGELKPL